MSGRSELSLRSNLTSHEDSRRLLPLMTVSYTLVEDPMCHTIARLQMGTSTSSNAARLRKSKDPGNGLLPYNASNYSY